jgi:phosphatidylglycerophosphatase C
VTPACVIFDFDGTLIKGDSFAQFITRSLTKDWFRWPLLLLIAPWAAVMMRFRLTRTSGISGFVWAMSLGWSARSFVRRLKRFADTRLLIDAKPLVFDQLRAHQQNGDQVLIVTGTLPLIVRRVLRAQRIAGVRVIGSRLQPRWGGWIAHRHNIGQAKVRALASAGLHQYDVVYTDSRADLPMVRRAQRVVWVQP